MGFYLIVQVWQIWNTTDELNDRHKVLREFHRVSSYFCGFEKSSVSMDKESKFELECSVGLLEIGSVIVFAYVN